METLTTPQRTYTPTGRTWAKPTADLWEATTDDGLTAVVKRAKPGWDDAVADEALYLARLLSETDEKYHPYLPPMLESFAHDGTWVTTFRRLEGFYTLLQVHDAYPNGIDPRDMAWMMRRLLTAISLPFRAGLRHCHVTPDRILIQPEQHGLVLMEWTNACERDGVAPANDLTGRWEKWVHTHGHPDLSMASQTMAWLLGGPAGNPVAGVPDTVPRQIRTVLTAGAQTSAEVDPVDVLRHFDTALEVLYGKRKFRPFSMIPATATN